MTKTKMTRISKSRRFNGLALALALSAGTAGGLFTVSAMTEPAAAQAVASAGIPTAVQAEPAVAAPPAAQPQRPAPRVVRINGFANCAVVKQVKTTPGAEPDYRCDRAM